MNRERGDEIPYGEPRHMDSTDLCPDGPSEDDIRRSVRDWLDEQRDFDAAEFFEGYIDPEGPFRYCGSFDARDAIDIFLRDDPHFLADRLRDYVKECC